MHLPTHAPDVPLWWSPPFGQEPDGGAMIGEGFIVISLSPVVLEPGGSPDRPDREARPPEVHPDQRLVCLRILAMRRLNAASP